MDEVWFAVAAIPFGRIDVDEGEDVVLITVNGRDFLDVVTDYERPLAVASGLRGVNSYAPVAAKSVLLPHGHWFGSPATRLSLDGSSVVLTCRCGDWECGGLLARITAESDIVTWSDFRTPQGLRRGAGETASDRGDISRAGLGPFHFDRTAYEAALRSPGRISWPYPVSDEEAQASGQV